MTGYLVDWGVAGLLVVGGLFGLIGSFGLVRLKGPMQRLHAPTKAATLGVQAVLAASAIWLWSENGKIVAHELLIVILVFLTAPLSAFYLANLHLARNPEPDDVPPTGTGKDWATRGAGPESRPR